jgi:bifunctional non-homologous end joining protein LigD
MPRPRTTPATDALDTYRSKRDASRTPEPVPTPRAAGGEGRRSEGLVFVVQEHHARALHWDFRLERDGVLASWAVPKGLPLDRGTRRLAVRTEDHPMEYATFEGAIPEGEYGGGGVSVWDRGSYRCEKWSDDEVLVDLDGVRLHGRYVLIRTGGKNWIVQRLDDPDGDRVPLPELVRPMLATTGALPTDDAGWGYEFKWDGVRVVCYVQGGRVRLLSRNDRDVTVSYPELHRIAEPLGSREAVLDGEIVAFDADGRPSFGMLQQRMHVADAGRARRLAEDTPVAYVVFDVLFLDGAWTTGLPYRRRRALLGGLPLGGPHVAVPPWFDGGGDDVLAASHEQNLEGVVAKRTSSAYQPGKRSHDWVKVKNVRTQEVVVVGWAPGKGRRSHTIGALLLGLPGRGGLVYAGRVGTGFTEAALDDLARILEPLERSRSALSEPVPPAQSAGVHWVEPRLVVEVGYGEWTAEGRLRHPRWRGLRPDKDPADVVRES